MDCDGVVLTSPAWQTADLVREMDPKLAEALLAIPFTSSAVACMVYDRARLPPLPEGFGFVVRALQYGGLFFEDDKSGTLPEAMAALEKGLNQYFEREGIELP